MLLQLFTCTTKKPPVKGQRGVKQNAEAFAFLQEYMAANMMRTAGHMAGISSLYQSRSSPENGPKNPAQPLVT
jgi:hypothetical protein